MISAVQYRKLMKTYRETQNLTESARKAGVDRKTARKCVHEGPPQSRQGPRTWRTREDPFEEIWEEIEGILAECPKIKVVRLLTEIQRRHPKRFPDNLLRTLQRRVSQWRQGRAKDPELYFPQEHLPGERVELDWFDAKELGVTIGGEAFEHLLCHTVLPYSNWEWVVPARSESYLSLKRTLQTTLWQLGKAPLICQTDNSSTATHQLRRGKKKRGFNDVYVALLGHYRMRPESTNVRSPHENGDVESAHGHLRSYLNDSLDLRDHRDFESLEDYQAFLAGNCHERNGNRREALAQELEAMKALPTHALPEYEVADCRVSKDGVVRLAKIGYSVPAKWANIKLRAHLYEDRIELFHGRVVVEAFERRHGDRGTYINWRHLLEALQRKPGAFRRYRYREHFFPKLIWRKAYDALQSAYSEGRAEREYLGLLALALPESDQERVEALVAEALAKGELTLDAVRQALGTPDQRRDRASSIEVMEVDLNPYDRLLAQGED